LNQCDVEQLQFAALMCQANDSPLIREGPSPEARSTPLHTGLLFSKSYHGPSFSQSVSYPRPTATTRHARAYRHHSRVRAAGEPHPQAHRVRSIGPAGSAYIHESTNACTRTAHACLLALAGAGSKGQRGGEARAGPGAVTRARLSSAAAALLAVGAR